MKKMALMAILALVLTACSNEKLVLPKLHPIEPKISKIKKCGTINIKTNKKFVYLRKKDAICLKEQLRNCAKDRAKLIVANKANVAQIKTLLEANK